MSGYNAVFKRYEKKYVLSSEQYEEFRKLIDEKMQVDCYGRSTICNIYYDTDDYQLIRASIEKPVYKEKLRLRSYGVPSDNSDVFLEIKKKYKGIVYKRRVSMNLMSAYKSIEQRKCVDVEGQISNEIDYMLGYYNLKPSVFLAYDRIAMYGKEDSQLRITFDFNIRHREKDVDLSLGDEGELLLSDGEVIMEIKVGAAYPFWLVRAMEALKLHPASFSKYGNVYKKCILPELIASHR